MTPENYRPVIIVSVIGVLMLFLFVAGLAMIYSGYGEEAPKAWSVKLPDGRTVICIGGSNGITCDWTSLRAEGEMQKTETRKTKK